MAEQRTSSSAVGPSARVLPPGAGLGGPAD
ncbi:hypothetical protein QFZ71_005950 [Streptomyces sp. V2I9]|nr:hypothetical protein [Streptomyces sp. V2I9]